MVWYSVRVGVHPYVGAVDGFRGGDSDNRVRGCNRKLGLTRPVQAAPRALRKSLSDNRLQLL